MSSVDDRTLLAGLNRVRLDTESVNAQQESKTGQRRQSILKAYRRCRKQAPAAATRHAEQTPLFKAKIAVLGEEAVGKTSLIYRFVSGSFDASYIRTLGVMVSKKTVELDHPERGRVTVYLMVHDLMGKQTFLRLFQEAYFRGVQGVLAVFDVTRSASLRILPRRIDSAREVAGPVPMYVLGNKTDLKDRRETSDGEAAEILGPYGSPILYTSAKSGENVDEAFRGLATDIVTAPGDRYCE